MSAQHASFRPMDSLSCRSARRRLGGDGVGHRFAVSTVAYFCRGRLWAGDRFSSLEAADHRGGDLFPRGPDLVGDASAFG